LTGTNVWTKRFFKRTPTGLSPTRTYKELDVKLVTVAEMLKIEKEADAGGHTYEKMMEAAGRGLAEAVEQLAAQLPDISAYGLVGSGNNGGDTLVALAHLASEFGWTVGAYLVRPRPEGDPYVARLEAAGGRVSTLAEDKKYRILHEGLANHAVLLDGILGTGLKLPLHKEIGKLLEAVKTGLATLAGPPQVVAVDCPSGVDCELGDAAPETVPADLTVTMAAVKAGLLRFPAYGLVGELQVVGIGLPEKVKAWQAIKRSVAEPSMIQPLMPARPLDAHKGTFGTVLVIGGSVNYTGAPLLTGKAAYRVGTGLVTLAVPIPLHDAIAGHFPEATWLLLPHEVGVIAANAIDVVEKHLARPTAVALGPGIGLEDTTREFIGYLIGTSTRGGRKVIGFLGADQEQGEKVRANLPPLVVDADGLTLLRHYAEWWEYLPAESVLTPHPGEMAGLTGLDKEEIQTDRLAVAERFAAKWGHVVVLKGACTVIAAPDGQTTVIPVASPALARAGSGDVLTGVIAGLMAQGVAAYPAAVAGAWLHAQAGLVAAAVLGNSSSVMAGDILEALVDVIAEL
jgi:NAD(P)H-hydrate epimerase